MDRSCSGPSVSDPVTMAGGVVPNSVSYGPLNAGWYSWQAVYSGDASDNPATSACESLLVNPVFPGVTTALSPNTIYAGGSTSDIATLSGYKPTGTITFFESTMDTCPLDGVATQVGTPVTVSGNGAYESASQTFNAAGNYYYYSVYSGDANNYKVSTGCEGLFVLPSAGTSSIRLTAAESGAPSGTFGLSGCNVSLASVLGDGLAHSFTATPNCQITVTAPPGGPGTRYLFGGDSTVMRFVTCSGTPCDEVDYSYYCQLSFTLSFSVKDSGTPPSPTLAATQFGGPYLLSLTNAANVYWLDSGTSWSVTNPLGGSIANDRWQTSAATSGTISAPKTAAFNYYRQWLVALSFSISDNSVGYTSNPTLTGNLFGGKQSPIALTMSPASTWLDAASWTTSPNPLRGSTSTDRWFATTAKGTVGGAPLDVVFHHQFYVTFKPSPTGGGSAPSTGWYNANVSDSIKATPASGWKFEDWTTEAGITYANQASASTKMTVTASATIDANFIPKVVLSASPISVSIAPAGSAGVTTTIKGWAQSVTLSYSSANSGVTASFATTPITDSVAGVTDLVTINVASGVLAGTYNITITAMGADLVSSTVTITVKVT